MEKVMTSAAPTAMPNLVQIRRWGCFWANGWNYRKFLIPFFMYSPAGQTRRRIFTLDGSNGAYSRTWGKYWKFHVSETSASISTNFCTTIQTTKWSLWVVPIGAQQIQDGGDCHLEKSQKSWSPQRLDRFTKFGRLMRNGSLNRSTVKKIRISQIQDGGRPPFWKS